jgi:hypothetical protein
VKKEWWMDIAEVIDALRVFPRIVLGGYMVLVGILACYLTWWYAHLPAVERTIEVTAFYGMLTGGLFGLAAFVFKIYSDGGVDWDKRRAVNAGFVKTDTP